MEINQPNPRPKKSKTKKKQEEPEIVNVEGVFSLAGGAKKTAEREWKPFWDEAVAQLSKTCWIPKVGDKHVSCTDGFVSDAVHGFSCVSNRSRPSDSFHAPCTEKSEQQIYTHKFRFYPTQTQREVLEECFGCTRYIHNRVVDEYINAPRVEGVQKKYDAKTFRAVFPYQDYAVAGTDLAWMTKIPMNTRDGVFLQLESNLTSVFTQLRNGQIKRFRMGLKSKKDPKQTFFASKKALTTERTTKENKGSKKKEWFLFVRRTKEPLKMTHKVKCRFRRAMKRGICDFTVTREHGGRYYLCLPMHRATDPQPKPFKTVSLDPGNRAFHAFYSDGGVIGDFGTTTPDKLKALAAKHDAFMSMSSDKTRRKTTRKHMKRRCRKLRAKIQNVRLDMQRKGTKFLTENFSVIQIPIFETSKMAAKTKPNGDKRVLRRSAVRTMLTLAHYAFRTKLGHACKRRGVELQIVTEDYTSKTCGVCGTLNENLNSSKVFRCVSPACGFVSDRDWNAARNIFLKNY